MGSSPGAMEDIAEVDIYGAAIKLFGVFEEKRGVSEKRNWLPMKAGLTGRRKIRRKPLFIEIEIESVSMKARAEQPGWPKESFECGIKSIKVSVGESDVIAAAPGSRGKSEAQEQSKIGRAAKTPRERD